MRTVALALGVGPAPAVAVAAAGLLAYALWKLGQAAIGRRPRAAAGRS